jgi:transposase-like protein
MQTIYVSKLESDGFSKEKANSIAVMMNASILGSCYRFNNRNWRVNRRILKSNGEWCFSWCCFLYKETAPAKVKLTPDQDIKTSFKFRKEFGIIATKG